MKQVMSFLEFNGIVQVVSTNPTHGVRILNLRCHRTGEAATPKS
jgi:hypothetical protein